MKISELLNELSKFSDQDLPVQINGREVDLIKTCQRKDSDNNDIIDIHLKWKCKTVDINELREIINKYQK